jgi:hypothetical protein
MARKSFMKFPVPSFMKIRRVVLLLLFTYDWKNSAGFRTCLKMGKLKCNSEHRQNLKLKITKVYIILKYK